MRPFFFVPTKAPMELLTAVNRILPTLGEHPVTSLNTKHPTLAIILPKIDLKIDDLTIQGYWFNTFDVALYPDSEGGIAIPVDTLTFVPTKEPAIQRGRKLYNAASQTYVWTKPVDALITTRIPFAELPESMALFVMYSVMVTSYVTDIGLEQDVQLWQSEMAKAEARVMSEHLRNMKYSTRKTQRFQRIERARRM